MITRERYDEFNPRNERAKYRYRIHLTRALRKDIKTVISILKHLRDYELLTGFMDFTAFNEQVADRYIRTLFDKGFSLSYINDNIRSLREFLRWLERQKGYRSKLNYNHIDYLNISNNQRRTAKAIEYKRSYTYPQILKAIRAMPADTLTQKRDKAMISVQAECGLRISELRTVKLKNLIEEDGVYFIYVNPKDMQVKYAKTRQATFMRLPNDILKNILDWRDVLTEHGFMGKDPLFPQISSQFSQTCLLTINLTHHEIKSNTTVRGVFRKAFEAVGLPYIRPHSFRHTIVRNAEKNSPEYLNAVRQSLGHSSIETTFQSYGTLSEQEQRKRIGKADLSLFETA